MRIVALLVTAAALLFAGAKPQPPHVVLYCRHHTKLLTDFQFFTR